MNDTAHFILLATQNPREGLIAERDALQAALSDATTTLEQRILRLEWALRAIDTRLHVEKATWDAMLPEGVTWDYCSVSRATLQQICDVIVALTPVEVHA